MDNDGNTAGEALSTAAGLDEIAVLKAQVGELQGALARYEGEKVLHPKFQGEIPRYRLNVPCFLEDDTLHEEGEEIEYLGPPNMEMVPLNDAARHRMQLYIDELTESARVAAEINGRRFTGLITDRGTQIAVAMQDARRDAGNHTLGNAPVIAMPSEKGVVPAMPHLPEAVAQQRRRGRPPKASAVVSAKAPPKPGKASPQPVSIIGREFTQDTAGNKVG